MKLNLVEAADEIWRDLQLVREQAFEPDSSGDLRVKSPKLLAASANHRASMLERILRLVREIHDLDALYRLYQAIIDIIVFELAAVPEIRRRVLDRLQELNEVQATTPFAGAR